MSSDHEGAYVFIAQGILRPRIHVDCKQRQSRVVELGSAFSKVVLHRQWLVLVWDGHRVNGGGER